MFDTWETINVSSQNLGGRQFGNTVYIYMYIVKELGEKAGGICYL